MTSYNKAVSEGRKLFGKRSFGEALEYFDAAATKAETEDEHEKHLEALLLRAQTAQVMEMHDQAVAACDQAIMMADRYEDVPTPLVLGAYALQTRSYNEQNQPQSALKASETMLKLNPWAIEGYQAAGRAFIKLGYPAEGKRWYERAIQIDPYNPASITAVLECLVELKQYSVASDRATKAEECLDTSICRKYGVYYWKGVALAKMGSHAQAVEYFAKGFVRGFTKNAVADAESHLELGKLNKAFQKVEEALEQDHSNIEALYLKGRLLKESGDPSSAISLFDQVIRIDPYHAKAYVGRGSCMSALYNFDEAHATLEKAREVCSGEDEETQREISEQIRTALYGAGGGGHNVAGV
eukprot:gb/GECG01015249.1/.p1 GENE.gb/GECG01015249.1/~~gb/GECG01015249.1/.p1  ORF type:complete len:355 (+),score=53.85 gb/GECG01015249.1/:1-1065(+)